ncbi:MAG TPA: glutaredoxin 3 [Rhodospirillales bacterium]|nr:glutaredoxin 3 [Rhodospirillales bacterium]
MAEIEIYTSPFCGYCYRAKALLDGKGAAYREIDFVFHPAKRREMVDRAAGARTVPQIFIDGLHVGGSDELAALEAAGRLDRLLDRNDGS